MLIYRRLADAATPDDRILDLGTKDGRYLHELPGTVIALDIELQPPLDATGPDYVTADGRELPFADDAFNYVVLNQVLEHVDDREALVAEARRVLEPGGVALFSFPNRFTPNRPHGLPRWWSMLPRALGKPLADRLFDAERREYYREGVFPLSPIGARRLLGRYFETVEYVTVEESVANKDVFGPSLPASLFLKGLPAIGFLTSLPLLDRCFELVWGHVAYECRVSSEG